MTLAVTKSAAPAMRPVDVRLAGEIQHEVMPGDHRGEQHRIADDPVDEGEARAAGHRLQVGQVAGVGQRYRWCFGGIQILRMHWRSLLPGRNNPENRLTTAQRWSYLSGAVQWYGDLLGLIFLVFLLAGPANLATGGGELFRKLSAFLVATVPVLVALGLVWVVALLRRGTGASWRDALGAFFIWQSTSLVVARASVLGLFAEEAAFLRTPKTSERARWWESLKANWAETSLALLGALGIAAALTRATQLSGPLLAALLAFPDAGHGRRTVQQLGRTARRAAARTAPAAAYRECPGSPGPQGRRGHRGRGGRAGRGRGGRGPAG